MNIYETVVGILEEFCPDVDCRTATTLVESRILDSITMVAFVAELEDTFDITVTPVEIVPDNFNSAEKISQLVSRLIAES